MKQRIRKKMTESRGILGNLREFERNWEIPEESKGI